MEFNGVQFIVDNIYILQRSYYIKAEVMVKLTLHIQYWLCMNVLLNVHYSSKYENASSHLRTIQVDRG